MLSLMVVKGTNAGQAFNNCIVDEYIDHDTIIYGLLLTFPFSNDGDINKGEILTVCCDEFQCSSRHQDLSCELPKKTVHCTKIPPNILCAYGVSCRGIIGETVVTDSNVLGRRCSEYNIQLAPIRDYLSSQKFFNDLKKRYAYHTCYASGSHCENLGGCAWDNGGWSCSWFGRTISDSCFLQWSAPWPGISWNKSFQTRFKY